MKLCTPRALHFIGLLAVVLLLGLSEYVQIHDGVIPCPLCLLQRFVLAALGVIFFFGMAATLRKLGQWSAALLVLLFSSLGILLAGRQVWLQHLPASQAPDCGMSLQYLLQALPFWEAIKKVLIGSAECSQKTWEFLHLSLAEWSLAWFVFFILLAIGLMWRTCRQGN